MIKVTANFLKILEPNLDLMFNLRKFFQEKR